MLGLLNFKRVRDVYWELKNYFFILDVIDKNNKSPQWKKFNLRTDWIGRIYTIVSVREEDMGDPEEIRRIRVLERTRELNLYLESLNLAEVIAPSLDLIDESRSYLIVYNPYFSKLSFIWMGMNVFFPLALIYQFLLN
jgi:hypothetical protein